MLGGEHAANRCCTCSVACCLSVMGAGGMWVSYVVSPGCTADTPQARDAALAAAAKSHEDAVAALTKQHEAALAAAQAERDKLDKVQVSYTVCYTVAGP